MAAIQDEEGVDLLLIEDSPGDERLAREAFKDSPMLIRLHVATDGVEAMAFLRREGIHSNAPRPDLILLDLNLPRMDGREVLIEIKTDPKLLSIPTLVLTTSGAHNDISFCYRCHANCYIQKSREWDGFQHVVKSIIDFWLATASLSRRNEVLAKSGGI